MVEDHDREWFNKKIAEMINGQTGASGQTVAKWMTRIKYLAWKVTIIKKIQGYWLNVAREIFGL